MSDVFDHELDAIESRIDYEMWGLDGPAPIKQHERACTKCQYTFESGYPCACPACGGWTKSK